MDEPQVSQMLSPSNPDDPVTFLEAVNASPDAWYAWSASHARDMTILNDAMKSWRAAYEDARITLRAREQELGELNERSRRPSTGPERPIGSPETGRHLPFMTAPNPAPMIPEKPARSEKIPNPPMSSGSRSGLPAFVATIRLKMQINVDRFPTPQARLTYLFSRLDGSAKQQILPMVTRDGIDMDDYEDMIDRLETAFGDPDRKGTAQRALTNLRQHNRAFVGYPAEWERYCPDTGFNDETAKFLLLNGASEEPRVLFIGHDTDDLTLAKTKQLCQRLDSRMQAQAQIRPRAPPRAPPPANPTKPVLPAAPAPAPANFAFRPAPYLPTTSAAPAPRLTTT
jgi:hypothetical protein